MYTIGSELVPNATTDHNTKLHSRQQQIKDFTALFKEQLVNQVNQSSSGPANTDNKSRQTITRFGSLCRRNGHTLMYCRTKAHDDENKRQQTRNIQQRRTVFTHDYKMRRGPNFELWVSEYSKLQSATQIRKSEQSDTLRQIGLNSDRNRNPNSDGEYH